MNIRATAATAATVIATTSVFAFAAPAQACTGDRIRTGDCTGASIWKLKVGPDNGRLGVEAEVDSRRAGQRWSWRLMHNGSLSDSGFRFTRLPSRSFTVHSLMVNMNGTDTITMRMRNVRSGEVCRGTVRF